MKTPYLSIVLASRNDDYAGGTLRRLQVCVSGLLEQIERYKLVSELILVDWNPPADRPLLKDALSWPDRTDFCTVRVIEVPLSVHQRFRFSDRLPFLVHRARNVGIRWARGKFVLPTATDLLFSDALIQFLALKQLDTDRMYRVDRYDIPADVMQLPSLDAQLAYCEQNVLRIYGRNGSEPTTDSSDEDGPLHTNACGDFTLLSREFWYKVHGIPEEVEFHSVHFDGVLCYMACCTGAKEEVLLDPMRIYHIEHESIWRPKESWIIDIIDALTGYFRFLKHISPRLASRLAARAEGIIRRRTKIHTMGIPSIDSSHYRSLIREITEGESLFVYNNETWGLAGEYLSESVLLPAGGIPNPLWLSR